MALIRHGERMDRAPAERKEDYPNKVDPPLSWMGKEQG
jgi:hypothetical protein